MFENLTIRTLLEGDLDEIISIERDCHSHPWSVELFLQEMHNPVSRIDLCTIKGRVAGYLCSWFVSGELEIQNVSTSPSFRRRGVAAALLKHVLQRAEEQGLERALLEVRRSNAGAIALYRAFGFEMIGCRQSYYADGEDALLMQRNESSYS